jgi:hypothetical protein
MNLRGSAARVFTIAFTLTVAACFSSHLYLGQKMRKVHKLEFPLLLSGADEHGPFQLLPKGTTLYQDQTYPEGFTRYIMYVNVDRLPLPARELNDSTEIRPLTAFAIDKHDLKRLLDENPLTKEELVGILKSGRLSKDDIREVLTEFAK